MRVRTDAVLVSPSRETTELGRVVFSKTLWIMRRDAQQIEAAIAWLDGQWETRFMDQASLITWRRFGARSIAVAYADLLQQDLERDGWQ